jgi:Xaa-Pro aminopeptidase
MNYEGRITKVRGVLADNGVDALLVTNLTNARYLTGFSGTNAQVLITGDRAIFFSDPRYEARAAALVEGALLNPAAYSHTSRAIADAIRGIGYPVIEVHLSNIHARDEWRRTSVTAEAARGIVAGFGPHSYVAALHALRELMEG